MSAGTQVNWWAVGATLVPALIYSWLDYARYWRRK